MINTSEELKKALGKEIPSELLEILIAEYIEIKTQFALGRYRPDELSGGRFAEAYLRILASFGNPARSYTPVGAQLNRQLTAKTIRNTNSISSSLRTFVLPILEFLLDVRNRRDVAHIGNEINPNFSDARLVCQLADWSLTELIRLYIECPIVEAQKIVDRINQVKIPIVAEVQGFIRVLDAKLKASDQVQVILYHKQPEPQRDEDLCLWIQYKNSTRFKSDILGGLNKKALIHYDKNGFCYLLPSGILYVEKNLNLELMI